MKRLLLSLLLVVALVATGCGNDDGSVAATVNGTDISRDDLLAELKAAADDPSYAQLLGIQGPVTGETEGTYDATVTANVLTQLIVFQVILDESADRGLEVTDKDRDAALATFEQNVGAELAAALSPEVMDNLIEIIGAQAVLQEDLSGGEVEVEEVTDADVEAYFTENAGTFDEACAHHILVGIEERTPDEAKVIVDGFKAQLDGGAGFDELATAESDDPGSGAKGGDLGCAPRGSYVPEFEDAVWSLPIGQVSDPVLSEFGYHLIRVDERTTPTIDDVRVDIKAQLEAQAQEAASGGAATAFNDWLSEAVLDAKVEVDSKYGTWEYVSFDPTTGEPTPVDKKADAQSAQVIPPGGPEEPPATTPAELPLTPDDPTIGGTGQPTDPALIEEICQGAADLGMTEEECRATLGG